MAGVEGALFLGPQVGRGDQRGRRRVTVLGLAADDGPPACSAGSSRCAPAPCARPGRCRCAARAARAGRARPSRHPRAPSRRRSSRRPRGARRCPVRSAPSTGGCLRRVLRHGRSGLCRCRDRRAERARPRAARVAPGRGRRRARRWLRGRPPAGRASGVAARAAVDRCGRRCSRGRSPGRCGGFGCVRAARRRQPERARHVHLARGRRRRRSARASLRCAGGRPRGASPPWRTLGLAAFLRGAVVARTRRRFGSRAAAPGLSFRVGRSDMVPNWTTRHRVGAGRAGGVARPRYCGRPKSSRTASRYCG